MTRCVGDKVRITTGDGEFEGIVHLVQKDTITLSKVKICGKENAELPGQQHFYGHEIKSIDFLTEVSDEELCGQQLQQPLSQSNGFVSATNNRRQGSSRKSIMVEKHTPLHIRKMRDIKQESLVLKTAPVTSSESVNSVPEENADPERPHVKHKYVVVDSVGDKFKEIIQHIQTYPIVGLAVEAVNPGREGQLCWLQIAVTERVFLFDVLTMGKQCFSQGLRAILESGEILKVVHDCRLLADMLWHKFNVKLISVFDTQVADVFVYRLHNGGDFPRYVHGLSVCLFDQLGLAPHNVYQARYRRHNMREDQAIWRERPAPENVLEAAVKNVAYIRELRLVLIEKLLSEYTAAVDIYLKSVTEASFSDARRFSETNHLLPLAFQDLPTNMEIRRNDTIRRRSWPVRDKNGFQENCEGVVDPAIKYARDSVIHANVDNRAPPHPPPTEAAKLDAAVVGLVAKKGTVKMETDDGDVEPNISPPSVTHSPSVTRSPSLTRSPVTRSDTVEQSPTVMNQLLSALSSDKSPVMQRLPRNDIEKMTMSDVELHSKPVCSQEENTEMKLLANDLNNCDNVRPDNTEFLNISQLTHSASNDKDDYYFNIPSSVKVTSSPEDVIILNPVDWESVRSECHSSDLSRLRLVPAGHKLSMNMEVSPSSLRQPDNRTKTEHRMNKRYSYSPPRSNVSSSATKINSRYSLSPSRAAVSSKDMDDTHSSRSENTSIQASMHTRRSEAFSAVAESVTRTMSLHSDVVDDSVVSSDTDEDDMDVIISILKSHRKMKAENKKKNINSQNETNRSSNSNLNSAITTPAYTNDSVPGNLRHIGRTRVTNFLDDEAIMAAVQRDGITNKRGLGASDSDSSVTSNEPSKKVVGDRIKSTNLDTDSSAIEIDTTPLNRLFKLLEQGNRDASPR